MRIPFLQPFLYNHIHHGQVDAEFKLQDAKKLKKDSEMKVMAFAKKLGDIKTELAKHMDL